MCLIRSTLDGQLQVAEYRELMGFLEWFAWCFSHARSHMWGLHRPLRAGQELDQGPATLVHVGERLAEQLTRWSHEMYTVGGVSLLEYSHWFLFCDHPAQVPTHHFGKLVPLLTVVWNV